MKFKYLAVLGFFVFKFVVVVLLVVQGREAFLPMFPSLLELLGCFLQIPGISVHEQILYFVLHNEYFYYNDCYSFYPKNYRTFGED